MFQTPTFTFAMLCCKEKKILVFVFCFVFSFLINQEDQGFFVSIPQWLRHPQTSLEYLMKAWIQICPEKTHLRKFQVQEKQLNEIEEVLYAGQVQDCNYSWGNCKHHGTIEQDLVISYMLQYCTSFFLKKKIILFIIEIIWV